MKKAILLTIAAVILTSICVFILAIILSFKVVRQNTDKINVALRNDLQKIVLVPVIIPPETKTFNTTTYVWEMETNQKEITSVRFTHDTLFDKNNNDFWAVLEMQTGQDPSLFNKVLPAVISDKQVLTALKDLKQPYSTTNDQVGYSDLMITKIEGRDGQISAVSWKFPKERITSGNSEAYNKLHGYPTPILKALYALQSLIIRAFSS